MTKEQRFTVTRWIIFGLVALALIIPIVYNKYIKLPDTSSRVVKNIYDHIESLPEGSSIIMSIDFDPSSDEELRPMVMALLWHAFKKNLRVIGMTIWDAAAGGTLIDIFTTVAKEAKKQDGVDYAIMPFKPGSSAIILMLSQDIFAAYPQDYKKAETRDMPVFKGVKSIRDMKFAMCVSAGQAVDIWIVYGKEKGKMPLGAGCTGVMATDYYPYLQSKQLLGLMGGLGAAAQYEVLIDKRGTATDSMKPQTVVHALIIVLIIIGNIIYFINRQKT
ncbi:MAG: hypothetical protein HY762_05605 [Planctomycetes bacterium]|nr:hypothetical protein [Planctomycetota bacterium]